MFRVEHGACIVAPPQSYKEESWVHLFNEFRDTGRRMPLGFVCFTESGLSQMRCVDSTNPQGAPLINSYIRTFIAKAGVNSLFDAELYLAFGGNIWTFLAFQDSKVTRMRYSIKVLPKPLDLKYPRLVENVKMTGEECASWFEWVVKKFGDEGGGFI